MKKILSILMLLVAIVTGASAGDVTIGWTEFKALPACGGMVKISGDANTSINSSGIAVTKNTEANPTGRFTFTSLAPGYTIKSIDFTENTSNKVVSVTPTVEGTLTGPTDKKYTFTPDDKTLTEISFDIEATKNSECRFKVVNVVLTTSSTDVFERMTITSITNNTVGYTNSAGENAKSVLTSNITSGSTGRIQVKKDRYIQISSETNNIKYIAIKSYQDATMVFNADQGTFTSSNFSWTPGTESYKTVKLNGPTDNTSFYITDVFVIMEPSAPVVKHSVAYNLGDGTSATGAPTQADVAEGAKFTVANAPTDLVPPTGKEFKCWNDGTNDYNADAEYTMGESDVEFTAVYQNETVKYAVAKTTPENGSIAVSATEAAEGETITLTATPDFRYAFGSWNVYKTGDTETKVTVTDNQFTMPAYAVTVDATFVADTRKQVLYVTSDGNVNSGDDLYAALSEDYTVTKAAYNASKTVTDFDLVVLHESITGSNYNAGLVKAAKEGNVPVLNTKSYFYNESRWGWGTPNAGTTALGCTLSTTYLNIASHPIFAGITTTDGFIKVANSTSSDDKVMQPVTALVSGKEGYTLATSPNASSGNGTAIHELTPAQRGVESAKYLMISVHNQCLNDLDANGTKLFKNAAEYLMSNEAWTPEESMDLTLNNGGDSFTKGFTTFCSPVNFTVTNGTAYKAAIADGKMTMAALEGVIPANTGVVIAGTKDAVVTVTATTDAATEVTGNDLKGTTAAAKTADLKGTAAKFLAFKKTTSTFTPYGGENFPANKAYILLDGENAPLSLEMVLY
jgi:hypothetical protein